MIITQTPLRISFAGGGTDLAAFYEREEGCVISSAIDKYIYVIIKERFDRKIRVGYSRTEMVDSLEEVEHELVRECLRRTGIRHGIEVATMADIPSEGSGLGSSSSVTVGLLHAMYAYRGVICKAEDLAREACEIEVDILGKPIGKQDQYIAAYGGMRLFRFRPDGAVAVEEMAMEDDRRRRLGENLMLFFTGMTRSADEILHEQRHNVPGRCEILRKMKEQTFDVRDCLGNGANLNRLGRILDRGWELKRQLASRITNCALDEIYEIAVDSGAIGGKVCGAGGGGFLLLCCPPDRQPQVRTALSHLKELPFCLERDGTKVIFNVRR